MANIINIVPNKIIGIIVDKRVDSKLLLHNDNFKTFYEVTNILDIKFNCDRYVQSHKYNNFIGYRDYMFLYGTEDYEKEHLYDFLDSKDSFISLLKTFNIKINKDQKLIIAEYSNV